MSILHVTPDMRQVQHPLIKYTYFKTPRAKSIFISCILYTILIITCKSKYSLL